MTLSERAKFYIIDELEQKIEDFECCIARTSVMGWSAKERARVINGYSVSIEECRRGIYAVTEGVEYPLSEHNEVLFRMMR